jgi:FkbM family methyltransferase
MRRESGIGFARRTDACRYIVSVVRKLGMVGAFHYLVKERILRLVGRVVPKVIARPYALYSPECPTAVWCRPLTSDRMAFAQIFIDRGYPVPARLEPRLIVDCGANVGYASLFFLGRSKTARVVAIEPDDRNYALLARNLRAFGDRAETIHGAVWRREAGLRVLKGCYRDGLEWATQVRECVDGESPELIGTTIQEILARSDEPFIDILKIDIEGAEAEMFAGVVAWIDRVRVLMIELHDAEASRAFHRALWGRPFRVFERGELTIAERVDAA